MANSNVVTHPGKLLLSEIGRLDMKQKELALRTGVSEKHISTIINGTKDISASFARKLDVALGAESGTWAKHQAEYDHYMAQLEEENGITEDEFVILKSMHEIVNFFLAQGIMHNHCGDSEKVIQLRQTLRVNNLSVIPQITYNASYRAQVKTSTNVDPYVLFAWLRLCEIYTESVSLDTPYSRELLIGSIAEIKEILFEHDPNEAIRKLKVIFAKCGITFEVVKHFRGAPVQGFIKPTEKGTVILCLTIRGKKADRFWFTLFHEIGHLVNGDLNTRFVDFNSVQSETEAKADIFARDTLIDPDLFRAFVASGEYHTLKDIKRFSQTVGVPYWVTIGRLHNDEWLDWSYLSNEIPSYSWASE